jgi:hypothetical protein
VSAGRRSEIRPWLRDVLGTRFELKLGDPVESEVNSRVSASPPTGGDRKMVLVAVKGNYSDPAAAAGSITRPGDRVGGRAGDRGGVVG